MHICERNDNCSTDQENRNEIYTNLRRKFALLDDAWVRLSWASQHLKQSSRSVHWWGRLYYLRAWIVSEIHILKHTPDIQSNQKQEIVVASQANRNQKSLQRVFEQCVCDAFLLQPDDGIRAIRLLKLNFSMHNNEQFKEPSPLLYEKHKIINDLFNTVESWLLNGIPGDGEDLNNSYDDVCSHIRKDIFDGQPTEFIKIVREKLYSVERALAQNCKSWRERRLPKIAHLVVDATYIKVRIDGSVRDCAVLTAIGVRREDGKRMILGVSAALSEAEPHWRSFLMSLKQRGIGIPDSVTSDAHEGLKAALRAAFNASPWQRCQSHLQQNAQAYVPKIQMRESVTADIRTLFNADSMALAEERLRVLTQKYEKSAPRLSDWMEQAIPEGLTIFSLPEHKRKRLRTSNMSENLNKQIKRRTKIAGLFPNTSLILRFVTAILMEISEDWETGKAYLNIKK